MLSVIIAGDAGLPSLLAQLTPAAVSGVVRDVQIVTPAMSPLVAALCEETGAEPAADLATAGARAAWPWCLVLPADLRLRDGWMPSLEQHLAAAGGAARLVGLAPSGLFGRWAAPQGVLVESRRLAEGAQLQRLRRQLRRRPRIG